MHKKFSFSICFFLLIYNILVGQNQSAKTLDSLKISALNQKEPKQISTSRLIAQNFYNQNKIDSAIYYLENIKSSTLEKVNDSTKSVIQLDLAFYFAEARRLEDAQKILSSINLETSLFQHNYALSKFYNTQANVYFFQNKNEMALTNYRMALEVGKRGKDEIGYAKSLGNFAIALGRMGRLAEQRVEYKKALAILKRNNSKGNILRLYVSISSSFNNDDSYVTNIDSAIYYGRLAVALGKELDFPFGVAKSQEILSSSLAEKSTDDLSFGNEALEMSSGARAFFSKNPNFKQEYYAASVREGTILLALGRAKEALKIANMLVNSSYKYPAESLKLQTRSLEALNKYELAFKAQKKLIRVKDSIARSEERIKLNDLQTKYETEKKDQEIETLSQQSQIQELKLTQRNTMIIVGAVVFIIILLVGILFYQRKSYRQKQATKDMEQQMLRLQMNPHFIFNALTSIQNYILENNTKESVSYLSRFAKLMRQILDHSREEFVSIEEETSLLKNYMEIQQLRFQNRFEYSIEIDPHIDPEASNIPPLFAQPFIENAIEHGLRNKIQDGHIKIRINKEGNKLRLDVLDNGVGLPQVQQTKIDHNPISTLISKDRLALYEKKFKKEFSLIVKNREDGQSGTIASILLPTYL